MIERYIVAVLIALLIGCTISHAESSFLYPTKSSLSGIPAEKSQDDSLSSSSRLHLPLEQMLHNGKPEADDGAYAGILVTLSEQGLTYVREVLVNSVLEDVTPLELPDVSKTVEWPIGTVDVKLKNVVFTDANVSESDIALEDTGIISVFASGIQAEVSLDWRYTYSASLIPFPISDSGSAIAKVDNGEAWVNATMNEHNGTLVINVTNCETHLDSLDIELSGGASWLYQWFLYAFEDQIKDAMESALTTQILNGVYNVNNFLLNLPRQLPVDNTSAVDVTVVQDPILNSEYLSVGVRGEFIDINVPNQQHVPFKNKLPAGLLCSNSDAKMVTIALSDYVATSALEVYYKAGRLERLVDKLPQQSLLNTASWKFLIPQLYRKYPNEDMALNIAAASAPQVSLSRDGIRATSTADMTIEVLDRDQTVPVACISLEISIHAVADIVGSNITAEASLLDLTLTLKWSEIGTFPVKLVQAATRTMIKDVILPLVNYNLKKGFPLPVIPAIELQDADITYEDDFMLICTNVHYTGVLPWHSRNKGADESYTEQQPRRSDGDSAAGAAAFAFRGLSVSLIRYKPRHWI